MKPIKNITISMLLLMMVINSFGAFRLRDGTTNPEFVTPGGTFDIEFQGMHDVSGYMFIGGVLSDDKTWNLSDDKLAIYKDGEGIAPLDPIPANPNFLAYKSPAPQEQLGMTRDLSSFQDASWTITLPAEYVEGDTLYAIIRAMSGVGYIASLTNSPQLIIPIIVTAQKKAVFNTATMGEKRATGKLVVLKGLESAQLSATPSSDTVYHYSTATQDVTLATNPGNSISFTIKSEFKPDTSGTITTSGTVTLTGSDTLEATASGTNFRSVSDSWIYQRTLPKIYIEATPSIAYPGVYEFDTPSIAITLSLKDSTGATIPLSATTQIFYGQHNTPAQIGVNGYSVPIVLNASDTIRAIASGTDFAATVEMTWYYEKLLLANEVTAITMVKSYVTGNSIVGDTLTEIADTAHFGYTLDVLLQATTDSLAYTLRGVTDTVTSGASITILASDPDTIIIPVTAFGDGYQIVNRDFVFVRDTLTSPWADPNGRKFSGTLNVSLYHNNNQPNSQAYYDITNTTDITSFNPYFGPISINTTTTVQAYVRSDFAVNSPVITEPYVIAVGAQEALYADKSGDGSIDYVKIVLSKAITALPDSIVLVSPYNSAESRVIYPSDLSEVPGDSMFSIDLNNPFTFTDETGFLASTFGTMYGFEYVTESFVIKDNVAPVLVSARFTPGDIISKGPVVRGDDIVTVTFSEEVSIGDVWEPFVLLQAGTSYTLQLRDITLVNREATFVVENINGVTYPINGDTIQIHTNSITRDLQEVEQKNLSNRPVEMVVDDIPYALEVQTLGLVDPQTSEIPSMLRKNGKGYLGIPIIADFSMIMENDLQDGSLVIFDAVGNVVAKIVSKTEGVGNISAYRLNTDRTRLIFIWNGKNMRGRYVNTGAYHARLLISDGRGETKEFKLMLGIKNHNYAY